jgi:hypothetical protein
VRVAQGLRGGEALDADKELQEAVQVIVVRWKTPQALSAGVGQQDPMVLLNDQAGRHQPIDIPRDHFVRPCDAVEDLPKRDFLAGVKRNGRTILAAPLTEPKVVSPVVAKRVLMKTGPGILNAKPPEFAICLPLIAKMLFARLQMRKGACNLEMKFSNLPCPLDSAAISPKPVLGTDEPKHVRASHVAVKPGHVNFVISDCLAASTVCSSPKWERQGIFWPPRKKTPHEHFARCGV